MTQIKRGVVTFGFSSREAKASERLAKYTTTWVLAHQAPVYTQVSVPIDSSKFDVTYIDKEGSVNPALSISAGPPSLRIARGAVRWALDRGLTRLEIIAAKPHMWRAMRDMNIALGELDEKKTITIYESPAIAITQYRSWFNGDSEEWHTKSFSHWILYDAFVHCIPVAVYKQIAS